MNLLHSSSTSDVLEESTKSKAKENLVVHDKDPTPNNGDEFYDWSC